MSTSWVNLQMALSEAEAAVKDLALVIATLEVAHEGALAKPLRALQKKIATAHNATVAAQASTLSAGHLIRHRVGGWLATTVAAPEGDWPATTLFVRPEGVPHWAEQQIFLYARDDFDVLSPPVKNP